MQLLPESMLAALVFYRSAPYVVKVDGGGRVVSSLHDPSGAVAAGLISQVTEVNGTLYLGSFMLPWLVRVRPAAPPAPTHELTH